jgi:hypothetical protein
LEELFANKTLQQFIYDTDDIQRITVRLQPLAMNCLMGGAEFSFKSKVLMQKLLCHHAYSNRDLHSLAVANLIDLERFISSQRQSVSEQDAKWYQMFVVDHAVARMYEESIAKALKGENQSEFEEKKSVAKENLIKNFESVLLPNPLGLPNIDNLLKNNDLYDPYILRAAHYYGHRGNEHLNKLQKINWTVEKLQSTKITSLLRKTANEGLNAYKNAINLRILAFAKSFDEVSNDLHAEDSCIVSKCDKWSDDWKLKNEAFFLTSQALADIANQYAAGACTLCYQYTQKVLDQDQTCEQTLNDACSYLNKATYYWRKANINGTIEGIGEPYRIAARKRLAEHMLCIASSGEFGLPINQYDRKLEKWEQQIFDYYRQMSFDAGVKTKS